MPVDRAGVNPNVPAPFFNHEQQRTETSHADSHASADPVYQPSTDEPVHYRHRQDSAAQIYASFGQGTAQRHLANQERAQSADNAISHCAQSILSRSFCSGFFVAIFS